MLSPKHFGPTRILVEIKVRSKTFLVKKKFTPKNLGPKNLGKKKI